MADIWHTYLHTYVQSWRTDKRMNYSRRKIRPYGISPLDWGLCRFSFFYLKGMAVVISIISHSFKEDREIQQQQGEKASRQGRVDKTTKALFFCKRPGISLDPPCEKVIHHNDDGGLSSPYSLITIKNGTSFDWPNPISSFTISNSAGLILGIIWARKKWFDSALLDHQCKYHDARIISTDQNIYTLVASGNQCWGLMLVCPSSSKLTGAFPLCILQPIEASKRNAFLHFSSMISLVVVVAVSAIMLAL